MIFDIQSWSYFLDPSQDYLCYVFHVLLEATGQGHFALPVELLRDEAGKLLLVDEKIVTLALERTLVNRIANALLRAAAPAPMAAGLNDAGNRLFTDEVVIDSMS